MTGHGVVATAAITRDQILGRVGALYLGEQVDTDERPVGTSRFIVDCLSASQTAAIAHAILQDPEFATAFDVKLPRGFMAGHDLPEHVLTNERATYYRNAPCERPALLLANTGDDEQQSLCDVTSVGAPELQSRPDLWVNVAAAGLPLSEEHRRWWARALAGLQDLRFVSLDRYADYVLRTRTLIDSEGLPIITALGAALPALRAPKDSHYFDAIAERVRTHVSKWKALYNTAHAKRACYLSKLNPAGVVLTEDDLRNAFVKVRDTIPETHHPAIEAFIAAPGGWTTASSALSECEWEHVKPLFDGLKREKVSLGQSTLDFYAERDPDLLSDEEREYLTRLVSRRSTKAELDDDKQFYNDHRDELREERKLKAAWERFVFGTPHETADFLDGIISCLESFTWDPRANRRKLTVSCERRFKKDLRDLNVEAGLYFAQRYRGLKNLVGRDVRWEVGELFDFATLVEAWRGGTKPLNTSEARAALQLKFLVELLIETNDGASESYQAQFVWKYDPQSISCELANDWKRLANHPLVFCRVDREPTTANQQTSSVDIWNVRTLMAAYDQDRGSLVGVYKRANDLAARWRSNLTDATARQWVQASVAERLGAAFTEFEKSYGDAIRGFLEDGLASSAIEGQLLAYSQLLEAVCRDAKGDRARQLLLRPLLQIGSAAIEGARPTSIVAPWHPLRMAAMARKARRIGDLVRHLLATASVEFGDPSLFFRELAEELRHPYYPEAVVGWDGERAELLSVADVAGDYSLHESPIATDGGTDSTNENPAEGASQVVELVRRYLALQPHEESNLSVVLYNCDSSRLPTAVVDRLASLHEDDEDVRCQVVLRHRDPKQLRALYEQIVEASGPESDSFIASETTRDFMARLRIGIMADQAPPPDPRDGCPIDIVFSQDVIARHARLEWYRVGARPADMMLNPAQWSRRRPSAMGDMKSVVYLSCPVQREAGWAYLTAVATFFKGDWDGDVAMRFMPARQLDFQDPTTARIFEETHNLGTWVVNYDELLDRRQLVEQGVRVIRYKQSETQGRNVIISSRAPLGLLRSMVLRRLRALNLELTEPKLSELAERFIDDANDISGDVVLRAAKRGRSASELIGLVLSRYLVRHELGPEQYTGWYFLDDYADWLGQREQQIADFMALSPIGAPDGRSTLSVVVGEAKYVDPSGLAAKRRESHKQLRDTLKRLGGAVLERPGDSVPRLDREIWLARLSDLLVDGVRFPAGASLDLPEWRRAIREGRCNVELRGYSHVFTSSLGAGSDLSGCVKLFAVMEEGVADAYQEVFGYDQVRELVRKYFRREDPTGTRRAAGGDGWGEPSGRRPDVPRSILTRSTAVRAASQDEQKQPVRNDDGPGGTAIELPTEDKQGGGHPLPEIARSTTPSRLASAGDAKSAVDADERRWAYAEVSAWIGAAATSDSHSQDDIGWLRQVETATKAALQQFHLQAKLLKSGLTPNAALLKFQGSANLTVDQVLRRRSEFLTTHGLDLVGVQPEPGIVALSIARPQRETVWLRRLWQRWAPDANLGNQQLLIGVREDDNGLLLLSPGEQHAPHTLIAGSTGSGKSVLMQNILLSIVATNRPDQARVVLIDPKQGVDYFAFEGLPHLDDGIIDRQDAALARLTALVTEMDARYARLRQGRAANLRVYNERAAPQDRIPILWLIHDEFAEWMLDDAYKDHVAAAVGRLGVKARAAGIHLVFAAQRPEANVMPMQLRANLGNRLILRVDSEGTSELALGDKGAERLLGRGHMLAKLEGLPSLVFAQVPYVTPEEIHELVQRICAVEHRP